MGVLTSSQIVLEWNSDSLSGVTRITNPTFDADITGWTETDVGAASLTPTYDTGTVRTGAGSLKLVQTAAGDDDHMSCTFSGIAGVTYTISAWINVTVFTFGSTGLRAFGPGGTPNSITVISGTTGGWVEQTVSVTPTTSGNVTVRLYCPQGTCYWDDVTVEAWTTIPNSEIRSLEWWAGIDREGNDPEPGGMIVTLRNIARKWEPLFGSNLIDTQQRFRLTVAGVQEGVFYSQDFELAYPSGQEYSEVTITCGDGFDVLAQDDLPGLDPPDAESYADVVAHDQPLAHYPLDDAKGTQAVAVLRTIKRKGKKRRKVKRGERVLPTEVQAASGNEGQYVDPSSFGVWQQPPLILGDTGYSFEPVNGAVYARALVDRTAFYEKNALTVETWKRFGSSGIYCAGPWNAANGRNIFQLDSGTGGRFQLDLSGGLVQVDRVSADPAADTIEHFVGTWDGQTACLYINGVLENSTAPGGQLDQGDADEFVYMVGGGHSQTSSGKQQDETAFYEHVLTAERVLAHFQAGAERGFAQQTAGERIAAIAIHDLWVETEIQTSGRDVQPVMQHGQPRLEEIAETAHAEGPRTLFFFNGDGNPVYLGHEFQATDAVYNTVQATFSDDGIGVAYIAEPPRYDNEVYNEVLASHESGPEVLATDTSSQGQRGRRARTEETDLLLMEHNHVESLAYAVLALYQSPAWRHEAITINSHRALTQIKTLDLGYLVRVQKAGVTGDPIDRVTTIIGKRKWIDRDRLYSCTYTLARGFDANDDLWRAGIVGFSRGRVDDGRGMTYETHIVAREGHMKKGEHVTDEATAVAVELETGISAEGKGATDKAAIKDAESNLARRIVEKRQAQEAAQARAAEDPMVRLARLEAIVREAGLE